jgi:uncharacterized protein DUF4232
MKFRALVTIAVAAGAGAMAAGCTSSNGSHTPPQTTTRSSGNGHHPTTVPATTSTVTPTTANLSCATVTAAAGSTQGAAGTIVGTITVTNPGPGMCTIMGYPTLTRFDQSGATVPVTMEDGITVALGGGATQPPALVTLAPNAQAEFAYQYSDVPAGSEISCAGSATLAVTTPGAQMASSPIALAMAPCDNGTVHVSPVYAGTAPL